MNFYYDCEFLEGKQIVRQWGLKTDTWLRIFASVLITISLLINYLFINTWLIWLIVLSTGIPGLFLLHLSLPSTPPTIDLISIGIVSEDDRELYLISKDFNLKEAWNRYDLVQQSGDNRNKWPEGKPHYWIRENVLLSIFVELANKENYKRSSLGLPLIQGFTYKNMALLIKKYGRSNAEIAEEIKQFVRCKYDSDHDGNCYNHIKGCPSPTFYGYYSAYDHVALCWLFGKMIDLPKGFPMYTRDLKQMLDEKVERSTLYDYGQKLNGDSLQGKLKLIKAHIDYPEQPDEHVAIADARWNKKLHNFIKSL